MMKKYFGFLVVFCLIVVLGMNFFNKAEAATTCRFGGSPYDATGVSCAVVAPCTDIEKYPYSHITGNLCSGVSSDQAQAVTLRELPKVNYQPSTTTKNQTLGRGVSNQSVVPLLQAYLLNQGFFDQGTSLTGTVANKTEAAIKAFQVATQGALEVDGRVGPGTFAYMAISQGIQLKSADAKTLEALKNRFNEFYKDVPKADRNAYNGRQVLTKLLTLPIKVSKEKLKNVCIATGAHTKYCKYVKESDAIAIANGTKTAESVLLGKAASAPGCLHCYCVLQVNATSPICQTLVLTEDQSGSNNNIQGESGFGGSCGPGSGGNDWAHDGTPIPYNSECIPRGPTLSAVLTYDNVFTAYTYKTNASGEVTSLKRVCSDMNWNQATPTAANAFKGWKSPEACTTSVAADDAGFAVAGFNDDWIAEGFLGTVTLGDKQYPTGDAHWQRMKSTVAGPAHPGEFSETAVKEQMNQGTWGDSLKLGDNGMAPWGLIASGIPATAAWLQVEDTNWQNFGIHRLKFCSVVPPITLQASGDCRAEVGTNTTLVTVQITPSVPVTVTGAPTISIQNGSVLTYDAAGSNANVLKFKFTMDPTHPFNPGNGKFAITIPATASIKKADNTDAGLNGVVGDLPNVVKSCVPQ